MRTFTAAVVTATIALAGCGGSESSDTYCEQATQTKTAFEAGGDELPTDPAELEAQFTTVASSISALADAAPDDLADELGLIVDAYDEMKSGLESVDWDFVAFLADPELVQLGERLESSEIEAAADAIDEYTEAECGFVLDTSDDTAAPDDTTAPAESVVDDASGTTDDSIVVDETSIEAATGAFIQIFGLDESKARCLAEKTVGLSEEETSDVSVVMGFFVECDISMAEISGALSS